MKKFYKGVLLLALAAFLGESLEFLVNMVLAKQLGEVGLGLYMSIMPVIFLVVIIASLELPVSVSKFVAEKEQKYHVSMLRHTFKLTLKFTIIYLLLAAIVLPNIPVFQSYHPLVKWLVLLLIPIISFTSIVRGYFMGKQMMGKIAFSNFLRKAVQLVLLTVVYYLFQFSLQTSILIAICTFIGTELVVCLYLVLMYFTQWKKMKTEPNSELAKSTVQASLLQVSIPTTAMRIFHSVTHAVQPFLIKIALLKAGFTETMALEQFGLLAGVAITIGFFPAFIAHSLMIVLIPTVSEAHSKGDHVKLQKLLQQVMFITFLYGIPAVIVCYIFADPLTHIFFENSSASTYLQLLWPNFLFNFIVIPLQAFMIGLGLIKDAFIHIVWSHVVGFALIFFLGSMSSLNMGGVIIGMNTGTVLLMMMHYLTVCNKIGVSFTLQVPKNEWR